ncbi:MAG: hypothetical protein ABIR71_10110, partial [Chthoniobacterales bacterium]
MSFRERLADREAKTESAEFCPTALFESIEDFRERFRFNPDAGVGYLKAELPVQIVACDDGDLAFREREFDGVFNQVPDDLLDTRRVGSQVNSYRREFGSELEVFLLNVGVTNFERIAQERVRIHEFEIQLHLAFADPSEIEQVVDEPGFEFDIAPDDLHGLAHLFGRNAIAFEHSSGSEHGRERRS